MTHLLSLSDWSASRVLATVELALRLKRDPAAFAGALRGRILLMLFEKPSLRTRLSFEAAMLGLGGHAIPVDPMQLPWGTGKETPADSARAAGCYVDAIAARLFSDALLRDIAEAARVPVVNALTDGEHPCQALGDLATLQERFGRLAGLRVAYVGDADNNVTHSLMDGCAMAGVDLTVGCPDSATYRPRREVVERTRRFAGGSGARLEIVHDARRAVEGADAVYTDTWMSYHVSKGRREQRARALAGFRVTASLMDHAGPKAVFMHCLPAERGAEVEAAVIDGPRSIVWAQAANRLPAAKAVLLTLLAPAAPPDTSPAAPRASAALS